MQARNPEKLTNREQRWESNSIATKMTHSAAMQMVACKQKSQSLHNVTENETDRRCAKLKENFLCRGAEMVSCFRLISHSCPTAAACKRGEYTIVQVAML